MEINLNISTDLKTAPFYLNVSTKTASSFAINSNGDQHVTVCLSAGSKLSSTEMGDKIGYNHSLSAKCLEINTLKSKC